MKPCYSVVFTYETILERGVTYETMLERGVTLDWTVDTTAYGATPKLVTVEFDGDA